MISGEFRSKHYYKFAKWKKKCLFSSYLLIYQFSIFRLEGLCCGKVQPFWIVVSCLKPRTELITDIVFLLFSLSIKISRFHFKKDLSSVNISFLWRKSFSCSAKRTQIFFLLNLRPLAGKTFCQYAWFSWSRRQIWQLRCKRHFKPSLESMKLSLIVSKITKFTVSFSSVEWMQDVCNTNLKKAKSNSIASYSSWTQHRISDKSISF